jgi:dTDP-4-dehydrorhamnose reductase
MSPRYLVTGAAGMLGSDLVSALGDRDVSSLSRAELDITDLTAVRAAVAGHDVILNAAAFTAVDEAESSEDAAYAVNAVGAGNLALAAADIGAALVQFSTDYVFDGAANRPYAEDAEIDPVTAYGRTKAAGERLALQDNPRTYIIRTAWLYGEHGPNFAATMLRLAGDHQTVSVVTDQIGQPTWTADLAAKTVELLESDAEPGIFHITNSGSATWFDFAKAIFAASGLDPDRVLPTDSATFARPARRPAYSVLGSQRLRDAGLSPLRSWQDALSAATAAGAVVRP